MPYQSYSTALKMYYSLGLQRQFVKKEIRDIVPNSTAATWKKKRFNGVIGHELEATIHNRLDEIQLLYHPCASFPRKVATVQIRLMVLIISCFSKPQWNGAFRKHKTEIIDFLDRFQEQLSYKQLSKLMGISVKTLYYWKTQVKFKCEASALFLCVKRHVNQATMNEVNVIKQALSKEEFAHWGIHSIWAQTFKQGLTHLSKQTWYRYNKLLNLRTNFVSGKKPVYAPLRAERINQIWHADITVFKTLDGVKHYIYTVMDNYSRYIHSWRIERVVSAKTRLETIQDALQTAFKGIGFGALQLVTDGGPENDNSTIQNFIRQSSIQRTIALRDIVQSNSTMEAFYRITKYQWLYRKKINNGKQLQKEFEHWINEYHFEKPHHGLGIYTPFEILSGSNKTDNFSERMKAAAQERRIFNKNASCCVNCCD